MNKYHFTTIQCLLIRYKQSFIENAKNEKRSEKKRMTKIRKKDTVDEH